MVRKVSRAVNLIDSNLTRNAIKEASKTEMKKNAIKRGLNY